MDVMDVLNVGDGSCRSAVIGVGGAMADDRFILLLMPSLNKLLGLEDTEYIEFLFTVLLLCSPPLVVSLEVLLFALVASDVALRAN